MNIVNETLTEFFENQILEVVMDYNVIGYAVLTSDGFKSFETAEEA